MLSMETVLKVITAIIDITRELPRFPELMYEEHRTNALVREKLDELGIEYEFPIAETGVLASAGPTNCCFDVKCCGPLFKNVLPTAARNTFLTKSCEKSKESLKMSARMHQMASMRHTRQGLVGAETRKG